MQPYSGDAHVIFQVEAGVPLYLSGSPDGPLAHDLTGALVAQSQADAQACVDQTIRSRPGRAWYSVPLADAQRGDFSGATGTLAVPISTEAGQPALLISPVTPPHSLYTRRSA